MMVSWFLALVTVQAASVGFNIAVLLHAFAERAHLGALAGNACSTALKFNASDAYVLFVCFFVVPLSTSTGVMSHVLATTTCSSIGQACLCELQCSEIVVVKLHTPRGS